MIDRQYLIDNAVGAIVGNRGKLQYSTIHKVLQGNVEWPIEHVAVFCLEGSLIYHNIPVYKNGMPNLREPYKCFGGFLMMANTNKSEVELVERSMKGFEDTKLDGSHVVPKLDFLDKEYYILKSGSGGSLPDFIGSDGKTYEVKYNYFNGSPSSLHNADYLINCDNPYIATYQVYNNHVIANREAKLSSYYDILSPRYTKTNIKLNIDKDTLALIDSGELIEPVEKILREKTSFRWRK